MAKKTNVSYLGVPQATIDAAVQDYLIKNNQLPTINTNQKTADQTVGLNVKTIIPKIYKTAVFISTSDYGNGSFSTIYQVPTGKVFILVGISGQISAQATSFGNDGKIRYYNASTTLTSEMFGGYGNDTAVSYAFNIPLNSLFILNAGDYIESGSVSVKVKCYCALFGYEISAEEYNRIT